MKTLILTLTVLIPAMALSSTTVVGNGDNGSDLEGFREIKRGKIVTSRALALKKVTDLNIKSIRGLGMVPPEIEKTKLYMTRKDISDMDLKRLGAFETDMRGFIYARTFARPHAATRFFPISMTLNEDQLQALHIHEALHRALPEYVREDEKIVSEITLAITSPDATYDSVASVANKLIPKADPKAANMKNVFLRESEIQRNRFEYTGQAINSYADASSDDDQFDLIHVLGTQLYPFGGKYSNLGLGIKFSFVDQDDKNILGPLSLNLEGKFNTGSTVKAWWSIEHAMVANSGTEFKDSLFGRDVTRLGARIVSLSKENLTLTNSLTYTLPSKSTDESGSTDVFHEFGSILTARADLRYKKNEFGLGGFFEYSIADSYRQYEEGFTNDTTAPSKSIVSVGPEFAWLKDNYSVSIFSRITLNDEDSFDYNRFGDIFNFGAGKENIGIKLKFLW